MGLDTIHNDLATYANPETRRDPDLREHHNSLREEQNALLNARQKAEYEQRCKEREDREASETYKTERLNSAIRYVLRELRDAGNDPFLSKLQNGPSYLADIASWAIDTAKRLWPECEAANLEGNPLALENARLRKELEEERAKRQAVEMQVTRWNRLSGKLGGAMAQPGE